ncbi:MAG: 50S ribosomal protein L32 [Planctomycetes bacterium]|nr:50S ribosomal protein L32 [Planctomycetota bacterium]
MPNPKRRLSKSKRLKRRTHDKLTSPTFAKCPRCKQNRLPHRVCGNCGYYDAKPVVKL